MSAELGQYTSAWFLVFVDPALLVSPYERTRPLIEFVTAHWANAYCTFCTC